MFSGHSHGFTVPSTSGHSHDFTVPSPVPLTESEDDLPQSGQKQTPDSDADKPDAAADTKDSDASSVDDYLYLHPSNLERKSDWLDEDCIGWHEDENEEEFSDE